MSFAIKKLAGIAALVTVAGCASFDGQTTLSNPTVGIDRVVVDAAGNQVPLPATLAQEAYVGENVDAGIVPQTVLKSEPLMQPTPATHPNASVVYTPQAYSTFRGGDTIFIYVGDSDDPQGRAALIPGSLWWPSAGKVSAVEAGLSSEQIEQQLMTELAAVTGGNPSTNIVFYCDRRDCWTPYNAALRLAGSEYQNVSWYRGGTEAWYVAGLPLEIAAVPDWL